MITQDDLKVNIRTERLDQIIDEDQAVLNDAILDAEATVHDALFDKYDTVEIFSKVDAERSRTVMRWLKYLCIYYIYDRIPDHMVPERVIKNYDDTKEELDRVNDGKLSVNLPRLFTEDGSKPKTNTRWSSAKKRSL
ncbi:phage protein Gp36 family protein [Flammeovirga aprica]|uniref:DUF1320 family protein n=1 Tax=Flammeovirga aprica JL-4 TaxID=694437 RepID=A0A7X9RUM7_9BACT|nr:phage protein Gp36 family protein [Flammeovirga aprica]NME69015.1 DUF1320 family protein [Flammeovirga aprica JL-4]